MSDISPESRDYSFDQIKEDPRIKRTTKEFFITLSVYIIYGALMILNLFTLGRHTTDYPFILGFPLWIFVLILLLTGMIVTVQLICSFVYKDMNLEASDSVNKAETEKETD